MEGEGSESGVERRVPHSAPPHRSPDVRVVGLGCFGAAWCSWVTIRGDAPEEHDGWGTLVCMGVDSDSSKKSVVWLQTSNAEEKEQRFSREEWWLLVMSVVPAFKGQRQDAFKAWATRSVTLPQQRQTLRDTNWLSSEEMAEVVVERLVYACPHLPWQP